MPADRRELGEREPGTPTVERDRRDQAMRRRVVQRGLGHSEQFSLAAVVRSIRVLGVVVLVFGMRVPMPSLFFPSMPAGPVSHTIGSGTADETQAPDAWDPPARGSSRLNSRLDCSGLSDLSIGGFRDSRGP